MLPADEAHNRPQAREYSHTQEADQRISNVKMPLIGRKRSLDEAMSTSPQSRLNSKVHESSRKTRREVGPVVIPSSASVTTNSIISSNAAAISDTDANESQPLHMDGNINGAYETKTNSAAKYHETIESKCSQDSRTYEGRRVISSDIVDSEVSSKINSASFHEELKIHQEYESNQLSSDVNSRKEAGPEPLHMKVDHEGTYTEGTYTELNPSEVDHRLETLSQEIQENHTQVECKAKEGSFFSALQMQKKLDKRNDIETIIEHIDRAYQQTAVHALFLWIFMTVCSFYLGSRTGNLKVLTGMERKAPMIAAMLMTASVFGTILPHFVLKGKPSSSSGIMSCALTVQCVALLTNLMMICIPTPVFIDPVCGSNVYLLRWCEWTPLAFVMTLLTEACRVETDNVSLKSAETGSLTKSLQVINASEFEDDSFPQIEKKGKDFLLPAYQLAWCQGLSTFCGWIFPMCPGIKTWTITMIISCMLFSTMFYRLHYRSESFRLMRKGRTVADNEMYDWAKLSLTLLKTCTFMWTVLVLAYGVYTIGPVLFPESKFLKTTGLGMVCESIIDVLFKSVYLLIILEVHDSIFDRVARAERRLEELRQMMSVVWDNSSDVLCISVKNSSGSVTTMLSPTYMKIYSPKRYDGRPASTAKAIAFDLDEELFNSDINEQMSDPFTLARKCAPRAVYNVEFNDVVGVRRTSPMVDSYTLQDEEIGSMANLVIRAWNSEKNETLLLHELIRSSNNEHQFSMRCEANITRMEQEAILIVVRDISERYRRFEAEKKVISETTARLKDAAANRFTRHEVKNGLLSAIGLCDSLRDSIASATKDDPTVKSHVMSKIDQIRKKGFFDNVQTEPLDPQNMARHLFELDKTLHEILDTILAEAMARDVIHEVYEPKLERVDLPKLLYSTMNLSSCSESIKRFPISTSPEPLPEFAFDPQLLKYIHRNAISNACKYGKRGGQVRTDVTWDKHARLLTMDVVNLPGPGHEDIMKLGDVAAEIVFSPRRRLTMHSGIDGSKRAIASHSSGDGAWIMYNCAKTLGGTCDIKFEQTRTVFSFKCPATPYNEMLSMANMTHEDFELPKNIWGIALDDSKIQRKLLLRFFTYAGIAEDRVHVKGGTADDIKGFDGWAVNFIHSHPNDYFLMIIDENLDIQDKDDATSQMTISGSLSISGMRSRLTQEQDKRVLALIRSANDSASDVAIYNSRAHGFLPKAPIKRDLVRESLASIWLQRFPIFASPIVKSPGGTFISTEDEVEIGCDVAVTMTDIIPNIHNIDQYALSPERELFDKWNVIWERMHALKGDLLIMPTRTNINRAIGMISSLRGPVPPQNFGEKWQNIRSTLLMGDTH